MSERGKKSRADGREKARKLSSSGDPKQKVDASSWTPGDAMNADAKTGLRPIRPRTYKAGGRIQGDRASPKRADKTPRKQPAEVSAKINRDVKEANALLGKPHVGGMKGGGRAKKMGGGPMLDPNTQVPKDRMAFTPTTGNMITRKRGGRADGGAADDDSSNTAPKPVRAGAPQGYSQDAVDAAIRSSNRSGRRIGGKEAAKIHALLKGRYASGGATPSGDGPGMKAGDRVPRAKGGRTKGKTNINIVIGAPAGQPQQSPPGPIKPPPAPPPMPPAMPPAPPQMPMGGLPPGGPPGGPPGMPPPMVRKRGGRTINMTAGAGSGLGRLQKTHFEARKN